MEPESRADMSLCDQLTYVPHAVLSQLTFTHIATDPSATAHFPGFLKGMGSIKFALVCQLFGWISQFIGHGAAEGRAPALLDSLLQGEHHRVS